ncbi:MAG: DUF362 domain-containing protein [Deltaproteobacteria bacterium]|nr:DUF362 domain-containing protein [Deltaproteobacteria bacterium]
MPASVYLDSCLAYKAETIAESLRRGLSALNLEDSVRSGDRVLLKPNLIMAKAPELATTTHPEVVRAVAMVLKDCGARLFLGDSPGFGSLDRCLEKSGLQSVMKKMDIAKVYFTEETTVMDNNNLIAKKLTLATAAFAYDKIINLPKLKTHSMMGSTLAVKNLFGFIPGLMKIKWHLRAGHNRQLFARIMLDIYRQVTPVWNFIDGIVAMEGEGPTGGQPRHCGLLALAAEAPLLDCLVEKWSGLSAMTPISQEAQKLGWLPAERLVAAGPAAASPLSPALKPAQGATRATFPGQRLWRRLLVLKPQITRSRCQLCRVCVQHCPAQAMQLLNNKIVIDYKRCIRCYCCQELCPYGAVRVGYGLVFW